MDLRKKINNINKALTKVTQLKTKFLSRCISSYIVEGYYSNIDIQMNTVLPAIKLSIYPYAVLSINHLQLPIHTSSQRTNLY